MSDDYILKYTNGYANYGKIDEEELKITKKVLRQIIEKLLEENK